MMTRTLLPLFLASLATPALAGYTGPQDMPKTLTTVTEVREYYVDDYEATLTGHIVKRVGHDKFIFRDGTGTLRLEIEADVMPAADFDDKSLVRVTGEIDAKILDNPVLDVSRLEILPRAGTAPAAGALND
jgi:uncharacterized protein (TIGR00156 family)